MSQFQTTFQGALCSAIARETDLQMLMIRRATISPCGLYRYTLTRIWDQTLAVLVFVMLNPSTADGNVDDPTIRKCIGFAQRLGYGSIIVVNLYAYRATKPADLWAAKARRVDIEGPLNNSYFDQITKGRTVVLAWGAHARGKEVAERLSRMAAVRARPLGLGVLARLADGTPGHPLMLPYASVDGSTLHASLVDRSQLGEPA